MMEPLNSVIYETLMRQAIANGRGGTRPVHGIDAGEPGKLNPAIGHRQEGGRTGPMGNSGERDAGRNRRQFTGGDVTMMAIATKMGARIVRTAPILLIMDGGRA